jgi:hypothetical protein
MAAMRVRDKRYSGRLASGQRAGQADRDDAAREAEAANRALGLSTGWNVFGYLIGGMIAYGGIGWLIGRAVHVYMLFPIGMLVGLAISVGWVIYQYGRPGAGTGPKT